MQRLYCLFFIMTIFFIACAPEVKEKAKPIAPSSVAVQGDFYDEDLAEGAIGGVLRVERSLKEKSVKWYRIYWGNEKGIIFNEKIGDLTTDVNPILEYVIESGTRLPEHASCFIIKAANKQGDAKKSISIPIHDRFVTTKIQDKPLAIGNFMSTMRNFYIVATYENATKLVGINKDGNTKEVIDAGAISSNALIQSHALFDSSLFITGSKNSYGTLWKIDERNLQTEELKPSNNSYFNPSQVVSTSVGVIFSAFDADGVQQLWRYTANGGLSIVDDLNSHEDARPSHIAAMGNKVYFSANDGVHGRELFGTDGMSYFTLVQDIVQGYGSSSPQGLVALGNSIIFTAEDEWHGRELWVSDGGTTGTKLLKDIWSGMKSSSIKNIAVVGDKAFFTAKDPSDGRQLWVTNGTEAGTVKLTNFNASIVTSHTCGRYIAFFVEEKDKKCELWLSDGTSQGTKQITKANQADYTIKSKATIHNGLLYYIRENEQVELCVQKIPVGDEAVVEPIVLSGVLPYTQEKEFVSLSSWNDYLIFAAKNQEDMCVLFLKTINDQLLYVRNQ